MRGAILEALTVTVATADLQRRVQANRDKHRALFEEALENYHKQAIKEFESRINRIRHGKEFDTYIRLPVPEDHTEDYDRVLDMLEMHTGSTIEISTEDFARFVRDDWEWKQAWVGNTLSYTSSGGHR